MPMMTKIMITTPQFRCLKLRSRSIFFLGMAAAAGLAAMLCDSPRLYALDGGSVGYVLVANKGDKSLGIIDPVAGKQIATIPEDGVTGHEVVASPDGKRAFVPIYGNAGVGKPGTDGQLIRVIDLSERKIVGTVEFAKGVRPHCAVMGPKNGLLYVTTELEDSITVIDPKTLKIVTSIPTGQKESHMLAITSDGKRGYTANVGPGTVSVLDLDAKKVLKIIPVSGNTQRIAISTDDQLVFTADQEKPRIAVIDTKTDSVKNWIELPGIAYGTAPTPDGKWLLAALIKDNKVGVINLQTMKLEKTIDVPNAPQEIVVQPDGRAAYVSCDASRVVMMLDLIDWKIAKKIEAGAGADGLAWARAR
jgi:YVTN family beta-propeller protein